MVLIGEGLSRTWASQRIEMGNAKRTDEMAGKLQQHPDARSQSGRSLCGHDVSFYLLVPWSEVRVRRSKGWFFEYVTFTMGHELAIPLRIRGNLAVKLQSAAGNHWPVEEA